MHLSNSNDCNFCIYWKSTQFYPYECMHKKGCIHLSARRSGWWRVTGDKSTTLAVRIIAFSRKVLIFSVFSKKSPESLMQNLPFCRTDLSWLWDIFSSGIPQFEITDLQGSFESFFWVLCKKYNFPRSQTLLYFNVKFLSTINSFVF